MGMMEEDMILVVCAQVVVIGAVVIGIGVLLLRNLVCRSRCKPRGRAVLVTGCDSGVGQELACHLDQLGFQVLAGVKDPSGPGAAQLQEKTSVHTQLVDLDVTSERKVEAALQHVTATLQAAGKDLWAVVNNAGICIPGELHWLTWEQCQRQIQVNLEGSVRVTKTFLPQLQQNKGRLIFVTSNLAPGGVPGAALLSATSAALDSLADSLRLEGSGRVQVSSVRLGDFSLTTGMLRTHHSEVGRMRRHLSGAAEVERLSSYQDAVCARGLTLRSHASLALPSLLLASFEDALLSARPHRRYDVAARVGCGLGRWFTARLPQHLQDKLMMRRFQQQLSKVTHL